MICYFFYVYKAAFKVTFKDVEGTEGEEVRLVCDTEKEGAGVTMTFKKNGDAQPYQEGTQVITML